MKHFYTTLVSIFFLMNFTFASTQKIELELELGLWESSMKMKHEGKEIDPIAEAKKEIEKLPKEQREQIIQMMKLQNPGLSLDGPMKTCYTQEMLSKGDLLSMGGADGCNITIVKQSKTTLDLQFKCEDKTEGTAAWSVTNKKKMKGLIKITEGQEKGAELTFDMKFSQKDCGEIKSQGLLQM
jgi:hypothetical protein